MPVLSNSSVEVENRARTILSSSSISELRSLRIEKVDGVLCLLGSLSSWYHKQLAQELLRRLKPEVCVPIRNLTEVAPIQRPPRV